MRTIVETFSYTSVVEVGEKCSIIINLINVECRQTDEIPGGARLLLRPVIETGCSQNKVIPFPALLAIRLQVQRALDLEANRAIDAEEKPTECMPTRISYRDIYIYISRSVSGCQDARRS